MPPTTKPFLLFRQESFIEKLAGMELESGQPLIFDLSLASNAHSRFPLKVVKGDKTKMEVGFADLVKPCPATTTGTEPGIGGSKRCNLPGMGNDQQMVGAAIDPFLLNERETARNC